jgi:hypothetical protein
VVSAFGSLLGADASSSSGWAPPGPYLRELRVLSGCRGDTLETAAYIVPNDFYAAAVVPGLPVHVRAWTTTTTTGAGAGGDDKQSDAKKKKTLVLATPPASVSEAEASLASCLTREHGRHSQCFLQVAALQAAREAQPSFVHRLRAAAEHARTLLLSGLRMPSSYLLCAGIAFFLLRKLEGAAWCASNKHPLLAAWVTLAIAVFLGVLASDRGDQDLEPISM